MLTPKDYIYLSIIVLVTVIMLISGSTLGAQSERSKWCSYISKGESAIEGCMIEPDWKWSNYLKSL